MMKLRRMAAVGILMTAMAFTGCANSDNQTSTAASGNPSSAEGSISSSGEATASADSGAAAQNSSADSGTTDADPVITVVTDGSDAAGQTQTNTDASAGNDTVSPEVTYDEVNQSGEEADIQTYDEVNQSGEEADIQTYDEVNQSGEEADIQTYDELNQSGPVQNQTVWEGHYNRDDGEVLTINSQADTTFFFRFEVCQIAGTASIDASDSYSAVYYGDDDNNIIFTLADDTIYVSVVNSNGDDTSEAVMSGEYENVDD